MSASIKKPVQSYLGELLFHHDCVIIPDFGGFVGNYKAAEIHPVQHLFLPPSKSISFNKHLTYNDGLLIKHVSKNEQISYKEAEKIVRKFAEDAKFSLEKNKLLVFPKIGKITEDIERNLQFSPEDSVNYLKSSFGLKSFQYKPIIREKKVSADTAIPVPPVKPPKTIGKRRKRNRRLVPLLVIFALLIGILQLMIFDVYVPGTELNTSNLFSFFNSNAEENELTPMLSPKFEAPEKLELMPAKEPIANFKTEKKETQPPVEVITGEVSESGYYLILGSFKSQRNATRLRAQLKAVEPSAAIFKGKNGFLRVGYFTSPKKVEAYRRLREIKIEEPHAWLLYRRGEV